LIAPPPGGDSVFGGAGPTGGGPGGVVPAAMAGYPSLTVPVGERAGLPVGLLFYGPAWSEARLLAFAADFEGRTRARRPPDFRPTATVE
jgi:amidase